MRKFLAALTFSVVLVACQTASYKETSQFAGTTWKAVDHARNPRFDFSELEFGQKLAPSGMGQVRVLPGVIVLFQVINGKLVMRGNYLGKNHTFDFTVDGSDLTLTSLKDDGTPDGSTQRFAKQ